MARWLIAIICTLVLASCAGATTLPDGTPGWTPTVDSTGRWIMTKVNIVDPATLVLKCKRSALACATFRPGMCEIWMPEYSGTPTPEWFWLLGREQAHCLYGSYHP